MSLFRVREWWSAKLGESEEFAQGSMVAGNVDNDPEEGNKLVTGSLQGMLRVHYPRQSSFRIEDLLLEQDLGTPILQLAIGRFIPSAPGIKAIAVLHPRKLTIFTVEAIGGQGSKVTHFNLKKAYEHTLGVEGGHFTAYNMTYGEFGGVSRDLLCVQSLDGRLQVFEQDAHAFTRRLSGILIPGPICYVAKIDAFVLGNSEMGVDCYKYQALAASQNDLEEGKGEGISAIRGLQAYWSCCLGEHVVDVFVAKFSRSLGPGCVDIVVLGERTLFTLREQGTIRLQKSLGYQPACGCKYAVAAAPGEDGRRLTGTTVHEAEDGFAIFVEEENIIIAADTNHIMVYKDVQLVWQAGTTQIPVALTVTNLGGLPGFICSLDEEGMLKASYQGTDPPTSAVVVSEAKDIDYDEINQEHRKLLQIIRRSQIDSVRPQPGKLSLQVQLPRVLDAGGSGNDEGEQQLPFVERQRSSLSGDDPPVMVKINARFVVSYSGVDEIRDATLNIVPPMGVTVDPPSALLPPIRGTGGGGSATDPFVVPVVFQAERGSGRVPSTSQGHASIMYSRPSPVVDMGTELMSARCDFYLPLTLFISMVDHDAVKDAAHGFTFSINKASVGLFTLFEDLMSPLESRRDRHSNCSQITIGKAVGGDERTVGRQDIINGDKDEASGGALFVFRYWAIDVNAGDSEDVSVASSKNSGLYRIQSASFAALCLVATELVRRLRAHFGEMNGEHHDARSREEEVKIGRNVESCLRIEYTAALPLKEFYSIIDNHFEGRRAVLQTSERLNAAAHQYRVVEKRLLARMKDRNPSPLERLDVVSEEIYTRLVSLADEVHRAQEHQGRCAANLACAVRFVALLAQCRFHLGRKDHMVLLCHLHPDVKDTEDQGWEENVDAAMTHLLRTVLAKVPRDSVPALLSGQPPLEMPPDTKRLKKHISIVCDRLSKGASLTIRPAAPPSSPPHSPPLSAPLTFSQRAP